MIDYKEKFEKMKIAGNLAAKTLDMLTDEIKIGISTDKIDKLGYEYIKDNGGYSAPLYYRGFEKSLEDSESYYQRYGVKALVIARFIPGVRTFLPLVMGLLNLSVVKFWIANLVGATLWVSILIGSGWFFGKLGMVSSNISFVIYGIMFLSILPIIYESMKLRWKKNV